MTEVVVVDVAQGGEPKLIQIGLDVISVGSILQMYNMD